VLHISGPFTAMKATADIRDQKLSGAPVESITFAEPTFEFSIPAIGMRYSGILNDNGSIAGTLSQKGTEVPLVLSRVAMAPRAVPVMRTDGLGEVVDGRFHDNPSGVEFDLPPGWYLLRNDPAPGSAAGLRVFADSSGKALVITVLMVKHETSAENIPRVLSRVVAQKVAMRAGQTGSGPVHEEPNYSIREGSEQQVTIGGHPAVRAIGEFQRGGKSFAEFLVWIITEHTSTHFVVRAAASDLASLEAPFDQMLESAMIP
jgi:hypothetical protein